MNKNSFLCPAGCGGLAVENERFCDCETCGWCRPINPLNRIPEVDMQLDKDYETQRKQVWLEAWTRTAQSDSCVKISTPTTYADECLKQFDLRFGENTVPSQGK